MMGIRLRYRIHVSITHQLLYQTHYRYLKSGMKLHHDFLLKECLLFSNYGPSTPFLWPFSAKRRMAVMEVNLIHCILKHYTQLECFLRDLHHGSQPVRS